MESLSYIDEQYFDILNNTSKSIWEPLQKDFIKQFKGTKFEDKINKISIHVYPYGLCLQGIEFMKKNSIEILDENIYELLRLGLLLIHFSYFIDTHISEELSISQSDNIFQDLLQIIKNPKKVDLTTLYSDNYIIKEAKKSTYEFFDSLWNYLYKFHNNNQNLEDYFTLLSEYIQIQFNNAKLKKINFLDMIHKNYYNYRLESTGYPIFVFILFIIRDPKLLNKIEDIKQIFINNKNLIDICTNTLLIAIDCMSFPIELLKIIKTTNSNEKEFIEVFNNSLDITPYKLKQKIITIIPNFDYLFINKYCINKPNFIFNKNIYLYNNNNLTIKEILYESNYKIKANKKEYYNRIKTLNLDDIILENFIKSLELFYSIEIIFQYFGIFNKNSKYNISELSHEFVDILFDTCDLKYNKYIKLFENKC